MMGCTENRLFEITLPENFQSTQETYVLSDVLTREVLTFSEALNEQMEDNSSKSDKTLNKIAWMAYISDKLLWISSTNGCLWEFDICYSSIKIIENSDGVPNQVHLF